MIYKNKYINRPKKYKYETLETLVPEAPEAYSNPYVGVRIFRDGEIDRLHEYSRILRTYARKALREAYKLLETILDDLDTLMKATYNNN